MKNNIEPCKGIDLGKTDGFSVEMIGSSINCCPHEQPIIEASFICNPLPYDYVNNKEVANILETKLNSIYGLPGNLYNKFSYKKVIFNDPATIILWNDGTKTIVKVQNGETYDPEKGLAICFMKKALGNKGNYYNTMKKELKKYQKKRLKKPVSKKTWDDISEKYKEKSAAEDELKKSIQECMCVKSKKCDINDSDSM